MATERPPLDTYFSLRGRTALVTGGGRGIGRQMASALAEAGADVVICGRARARLDETVAALAGTVRAVLADLVTDEGVDRLVAEAGPVDVLVNNAGKAVRSEWATTPPGEWREVFALNLDAPFRLAQAFVPGMIERGWGRVVNVASIYGSHAADPSGYPGVGADMASYFASKHALIGLTRHLAVMLAGSGVTVNSLSPGFFPAPEMPAAVRDRLRAQVPLGRFGSDEDLKAAIVFLAGPGSSYVTGHDLVVDGGWSI